MGEAHDDLRRGALNLLQGCAGAVAGETLLILAEEDGLGYYDDGLGEAVAGAARALGLRVEIRRIPFLPAADALPPELARTVQAADHTLFLARLGDQLRFRAMPEGSRPIVSYALDREALASGFGATAYGAFVALKKALDRLFAGARSIRVTCALGTDYEGRARLAEPAMRAEPGPPHAEEARNAPSRSTHHGRASFETPPAAAPQDEVVGGYETIS